MSLKSTLNLPRTRFPMQARSVVRERERLAFWESQKLYQKIQGKGAKNPPFILHDGPPFTNGDVHVGTALNKILKDIVGRYKTMKGYRVSYTPGWDCHGLPIEHKVLKSQPHLSRSVTDLRKACDDFSEACIRLQEKRFRRLGILADWEGAYKTKDPVYEAEVLRVFAEFVRQGRVYRGKKPIYWSIPCRTALAEAEIEYRPHTSSSVWVTFPIVRSNFQELEGASVVIWTTTPWTLPANRAIALSPTLDYVLLTTETGRFLVAKVRAENFIQKCSLSSVVEGPTFRGAQLEGTQTHHPFIRDRLSPIVLAPYVHTDTGTGCVHTAPGHGVEDYLTGLQYGLDIDCPVDDEGKLISRPEFPPGLAGQSVGTMEGRCPADEKVVELLRSEGKLLHREPYVHSYPHCWRSKTPVVFRAVDQWFVRLEAQKEEVQKAINEVQWIPQWGQNRIRGFVENRPDWCISRQRSWGIPLPVFYDESGDPFLDADYINFLAAKVEKQGTSVWFEEPEHRLLKGFPLPSRWRPETLRKGSDTLDVWMDSGCSHWAILKPKEEWPADLYLEGSDQHRGWFQSSLWTSVLMTGGRAPYRTVLTHGFFIDEENRQKISKSEGPPQTSEHYVERFGADVLRLWVASENYRDDIPVSQAILDHVVNTYRTLRNTLRFQLGNLFDFRYDLHALPLDQLMSLDQWALHETTQLIQKVETAYEAYEFHKVYQEVGRFCTIVLSARYHDILKDRLYTLAPSSPERRSAQTAIFLIFNTLVRLLAPILVFTTDEAYAYLKSDGDFVDDSIHLGDFPVVPKSWNFEKIHADIHALFHIREDVQEALEGARREGIIGQSLDAQVELTISEGTEKALLLKKFEPHLPEYFIVSQVHLTPESNPSKSLIVRVRHADGVRCPRTWRWVDELVEVKGIGPVSKRCAQFLTHTFP